MLLIYHAKCADGCAAAHIADEFLSQHDKITMIGAYHDDKNVLPDVKDKIVFMVDFVYTAPLMKQMFEQAHTVFIIDHHQTAIDMKLEAPNLVSVITEDHAASRIVWEIFHEDEPVPEWLKLVDDSDTGHNQYPESLLVKYFMAKQKLTPEFFADVDLEKWLDTGRQILSVIEKRAKTAYARAKMYSIEIKKKKYTFMIVVEDREVHTYFSDAFGCDVDVIMYVRQDFARKITILSLRAKRSDIDLLKMSFWQGLQFKGHPHAAAAVIPEVYAKLDAQFIKKAFQEGGELPPWRSLLAEV